MSKKTLSVTEISNKLNSSMTNSLKYPVYSSAVLIPLLEKDGVLSVLFEERSHKLAFQPGDVCFPGGKIEDGETPLTAAIRECCEELFPNDICGAEKIRILSPMRPMMGPKGSLVYPFVGILSDYEGTFNKDEVERVITYPLSYLLSLSPDFYPMKKEIIAPEDFPYDVISHGERYKWHVQKYDMWIYSNTDPVIWGFTGRLLHRFLESI